MSELRLGTWAMPAAKLGGESPHPQLFQKLTNWIETTAVDPDIPEEDLKGIGYGNQFSAMPYKMQDEYSRNRRPAEFRTAILENEILKAVFLLDLGGRLWSLYHKPSQTELLHVNPVFQPGNLAIRNAWFSGGVEWNFCWPGHTPFTCAPLFVARAALDDGTPVLRMYEFERVRRMPFQMDFYLPAGSSTLRLRVTLRNPHDREIPAYWWSNIAVPEKPGSRVMAPAEASYLYDYLNNKLNRVKIPIDQGLDRSYPTNFKKGGDNFYIIPRDRQAWICQADAQGRGLFQTSTGKLVGRKLFFWGQCAGSRRWQDFLSLPGNPYVEIQAGLTRVQSACRPLPAGATFEWVEAYGLAEGDPRIIHGADWAAAWQQIATAVERQAPLARLDQELAATAAMASRAPLEMIATASGWGALEQRRREKQGAGPMCGPATPFPATTLGPEQAPWLALLEKGVLPTADPAEPPASFMVQDEWFDLLQAGVRKKTGNNWHAWFHLGLMRHYRDDTPGAIDALLRSIELQDTMWARRNLARIYFLEKNYDAAVLHYSRAMAINPADRRVFIEAAELMLMKQAPEACLEMAAKLPAEAQAEGRIRLLKARAAVDAGKLDLVMPLLQDEFDLIDAREGDQGPSQIWFDYHAKRIAAETGQPLGDELMARVKKEFPPPQYLDYRMADE